MSGPWEDYASGPWDDYKPKKAAPKPDQTLQNIKDVGVNAAAGLMQGALSLPDLPFMIGEAGNTLFRKGTDAALRLAGANQIADNLRRGQAKLDQGRFTTLSNQIERIAPTKGGFGASRFVGQLMGGLMAPGPKLPTPPAGFDALAARSAPIAQKGTQKAARLAQAAIAKRLRADGVTPAQAGKMMDDAASRGVPLSLMDVGDNMRALGGYLSRTSGDAKTLMRSALKDRQAGMSDRVRRAIERDLGPISNTFDESDRLVQRARAASAPLYEQAYSQPVVSTPGLRDLMARPSMRSAVGKAYRIAQEEGRDPASLGFILDDSGNPVLSQTFNLADDGVIDATLATERAPSMQTMDYVKRGLDDVVEAYRDPTSNRLVLDTEGRAINATRADLLNELDAMNPAYAQARATYAGPAAANEALWKGKKALNASADELEQMTAKMGDFEREQFASGFRAALADAIDKSGGSTDIANKLLGSPRKRKAIAKVFGGEEGFANFLRTMEDEAASFESYRTLLGSPTAGRQMDDISGAGDLATNPLIAAVGNAAMGRGRAAAGNVLEAVRGRIEFGANKTAEEARNQAAALLSEVNPNAIRSVMAEAARQNALRIARENRAARLSSIPVVVGANPRR